MSDEFAHPQAEPDNLNPGEKPMQGYAANPRILTDGGTHNDGNCNQERQGRHIDEVSRDDGEVEDGLVDASHARQGSIFWVIHRPRSRRINPFATPWTGDQGGLFFSAALSRRFIQIGVGARWVDTGLASARLSPTRDRVQRNFNGDIVWVGHAVARVIRDLLEAMCRQSLFSESRPSRH
ncbi:unnamed protein product [Aspergillus oryzae]|uniref:Unnamed protein product n=1 Tax=Aspergillus oryzae TaxID=5062 RepID=A0AAN4YZP1_ASPOZ|nr:unnamed protein product [Aspergillus oryzae]GMF87250.1 unnamed protein product [Aspergillus oryzae]GMG03947.1 unnamed protein product [Aspergillus oryzae]GMG37045.1 unnamed protein product [Aspergillus oryzae]